MMISTKIHLFLLIKVTHILCNNTQIESHWKSYSNLLTGWKKNNTARNKAHLSIKKNTVSSFLYSIFLSTNRSKEACKQTSRYWDKSIVLPFLIHVYNWLLSLPGFLRHSVLEFRLFFIFLIIKNHYSLIFFLDIYIWNIKNY